MPANHPHETQLALYSGSDLGHWETWRIRRHLAQCSACRRQVLNHRENAEAIRAHAAEMPGQFNWSRLAEEMRATSASGSRPANALPVLKKPRIRFDPESPGRPVWLLRDSPHSRCSRSG